MTTPPTGSGVCSTDPPKTKFNCLQCRLSKVKCSRTLPSCDRCNRLDLLCNPQYHINGRPSKMRKVAHAGAHNQAAPLVQVEESSPQLTPTYSCNSNAGEERDNNNNNLGLGGVYYNNSDNSSCGGNNGVLYSKRGVVGALGQGSPRDLSCRGIAWDYRHCAELMVTAIGGLKNRGLLHPGRTMNLLRSWAFSNLRHKEDLTWGAYDHVLNLIGPYANAIPVETADPNVHPNHSLRDHQGSYLSPACLPPYLTSIDDDSCAITGYIRYDGVCRLFSNNCFSSTFMSMEEVSKCPAASLPEFLWSRILHPSERQEFFERLVEFMLSTPTADTEMASILLCQERGKNEPVQSLVRTRFVLLDGGMYSAAIMSILPLPQPTPNPANEELPIAMGAAGPLSLLQPTGLTASPPPPGPESMMGDISPESSAASTMSSHHLPSSSSLSTMSSTCGIKENPMDDDDAWVMQLLAADGLEAPTANSSSSPNAEYTHPMRYTVPAPIAWNNINPFVHGGEARTCQAVGGSGYLPGSSNTGGWGGAYYSYA